MTSLPSLTGKELLAVLKKAGFEVLRVKGSHHFCVTPMAVLPWFRSTPAKTLVRDCSPRFSAIAI